MISKNEHKFRHMSQFTPAELWKFEQEYNLYKGNYDHRHDITEHKWSDNTVKSVSVGGGSIYVYPEYGDGLNINKSDAKAIAKHFELNKDLIDFVKGILDSSTTYISPELVKKMESLIGVNND